MVAVGRNNGVVGLTGFSDKKMSGLLFVPQTKWSLQRGFHCSYVTGFRENDGKITKGLNFK